MRRSLFLFACLAILAPPAGWAVSMVRADSPFLIDSSDTDSRSSILALTEPHRRFPYRFVTFLQEHDSLAMDKAVEKAVDKAEEPSQEDASSLKLMLIEGGDERRETDTTEDQANTTEARVRAAIDSANPEVESNRDEVAATPPNGNTQPSDAQTSDAQTSEAGQHGDAASRGDAAARGDAASHGDAARLAARLAELNKPATDLRIAAPTTQVGETPINQAAQIFDQTPLWIRGGLGAPPPPQRVHVAFYHNPTYFQELNLERCGRLDCERCGYWQNLYSSVWFIGNTAMLPYRLAAQPPCQCVSSYGDCPSCHRYDCPIEPLGVSDDCAATRRGMLSQSAALAGFALLLW